MVWIFRFLYLVLLLSSTAVGKLVDGYPAFAELFEYLKNSMSWMNLDILPESYNFVAKSMLATAILIMIGIIVLIMEGLAVRMQNKSTQGFFRLCQEIGKALQRETKREISNSTDHGISSPNKLFLERRAAAKHILTDLRSAIRNAFGAADIQSTVMFVGKKDDEEEEKLFIEIYDSNDDEKPTTYRERQGFAKGEGYCGLAWQRPGTPVVGTKKRFGFLPDPVFVKTSDRQDDVKPFFP